MVLVAAVLLEADLEALPVVVSPVAVDVVRQGVAAAASEVDAALLVEAAEVLPAEGSLAVVDVDVVDIRCILGQLAGGVPGLFLYLFCMLRFQGCERTTKSHKRAGSTQYQYFHQHHYFPVLSLSLLGNDQLCRPMDDNSTLPLMLYAYYVALHWI